MNYRIGPIAIAGILAFIAQDCKSDNVNGECSKSCVIAVIAEDSGKYYFASSFLREHNCQDCKLFMYSPVQKSDPIDNHSVKTCSRSCLNDLLFMTRDRGEIIYKTQLKRCEFCWSAIYGQTSKYSTENLEEVKTFLQKSFPVSKNPPNPQSGSFFRRLRKGLRKLFYSSNEDEDKIKEPEGRSFRNDENHGNQFEQILPREESSTSSPVEAMEPSDWNKRSYDHDENSIVPTPEQQNQNQIEETEDKSRGNENHGNQLEQILPREASSTSSPVEAMEHFDWNKRSYDHDENSIVPTPEQQNQYQIEKPEDKSIGNEYHDNQLEQILPRKASSTSSPVEAMEPFDFNTRSYDHDESSFFPTPEQQNYLLYPQYIFNPYGVAPIYPNMLGKNLWYL